MTLEVVSFAIGGILIGTAIIGGGFEIKEIKMPKVGPAARTGALVVGTMFVLMGLGIWETAQQTVIDRADVADVADGLVPTRVDAEVPAPSRSVAQEPAAPAAHPVPVVQQTQPQAPPMAQGITGRARLTWNIYGAPYAAVIETYGQSGIVRVGFIGQSGTEEQVDQDLELHQGANLLFYRGSNPRYAGTDTPHPSYSPDAFRLVEIQSGIWSFTEVCDDQGVCAPVQTEALP